MGGAITSLLLYVLMVFKGTTLIFPLKGQGLKEMRQQESAAFLHKYFRNTRRFDFALLGLQFHEGFCISEPTTLLLQVWAESLLAYSVCYSFYSKTRI
jgi:hypothetical protein